MDRVICNRRGLAMTTEQKEKPNEVLSRLADQCWEPKPYGPAWFNHRKFAKLIVVECVELCEKDLCNRKDDPPANYFDGGLRHCANAIREHFGD